MGIRIAQTGAIEKKRVEGKNDYSQKECRGYIGKNAVFAGVQLERLVDCKDVVVDEEERKNE